MQAWGGIAGLQNCMDVMFDEAVQKRGMPLPQFARLMATNAADIFGLKHKGRIAPGKDADLVFIQAEQQLTFCRRKTLNIAIKSALTSAVRLARGSPEPSCAAM
ncbi:allantoinase [Klebsiella oxytoca]|nr:allantoinase [Klebsiella oxytoca]